MRNILITGSNSYIGTCFETYIMREFPGAYNIDTADMTDISWKNWDFSEYDTICHVAGIAHIKETKENAELYYKINRDLAVNTAKKAKSDGVRQFVFLSSMSVYGMDKGEITRDTVPNPKTNYGKSKLQAEKELERLNGVGFHVAILRPPMVYGKGCKGNYPALSRLAQKLPIFPDINNSRSMIYIDNLCEFIRLLTENMEKGVFHPQNVVYTRTSDLVKSIASAHGKNIKLTKAFNPFVKIARRFIGVVNKVFGNLYYEQSLSNYKVNYQKVDLNTSILRTEE